MEEFGNLVWWLLDADWDGMGLEGLNDVLIPCYARLCYFLSSTGLCFRHGSLVLRGVALLALLSADDTELHQFRV